MRWFFTATVALFAVGTFCLDSKSAKVPAIQKANAAAKEKRETALKEAHLDAVEKKASIDAGQKLLTQDSEHLAPASKQGETLDVDTNSETEQREQMDPHRGRGRKRNRRKRHYRRHGGRYRAYKRKFHNQRDYYYLKKIIDPDSGMVHDVATLDDIITLDDADADWPKKRKKRTTKNQNDDDSCSDDDD